MAFSIKRSLLQRSRAEVSDNEVILRADERAYDPERGSRGDGIRAVPFWAAFTLVSGIASVGSFLFDVGSRFPILADVAPLVPLALALAGLWNFYLAWQRLRHTLQACKKVPFAGYLFTNLIDRFDPTSLRQNPWAAREVVLEYLLPALHSIFSDTLGLGPIGASLWLPLFDQKTGQMKSIVLVHEIGFMPPPESALGRKHSPSECYLGHVITSNSSVLIRDSRAHLEQPNVFNKRGCDTLSMMAVPVSVGAQTMALLFRSRAPHTFHRYQVDLARTLAGVLSQFMKNVELLRSLEILEETSTVKYALASALRQQVLSDSAAPVPVENPSMPASSSGLR